MASTNPVDRSTQIRTRLAELFDQTHKPFNWTNPNTGEQINSVCMRSRHEMPEATWEAIWKEKRELRTELKALLLSDPTVVKVRTGYSVAGWSEKHDYFRNKVDTFNTLEEAQACLAELKARADWGIPTVIVERLFSLATSPNPEEFHEPDYIKGGGYAYGSDRLVDKHMCGTKGVSWNTLLRRLMGGYTY
ncbi:hypothetical protein [Fibrella aquatilis]|uniref:Uncharacterized protein n=1 Tax=Fibrella aquatilis TaxID=2817059 RepID=A0A939GAA9_9BACT|nr:hypothetical protein [Fibrella aquatilis]MBO0933890.1 hypothetical protein [Fibrella aquatilis]